MISVFEPTVTYRDIFRVAVNMRSTYISGTSPVIKEFEESFQPCVQENMELPFQTEV